ncbi:MAG: maleylpyruvate isomerase family mycothiol-dependent enzyme [Chloroflexi bacterium]|nr:maleylpyruvate isomerase family mycothiol-dependent enzyme [Chloroflexota bacterium]
MPDKRPLDPIFTLDLFPELRAALIALLESLTDEAWERPTTCCPGWSVKDMAAHLLGDHIGILSGQRDRYAPPTNLDLSDWATLIQFINERNDVWVRAMRRLSPRVLVELLAETGIAVDDFFGTLDPFIPWVVVSWAGSDRAPAWMGIAREYTEYWMHQQHIRDSVGQPGLKEPRFFAPVLEAFMRALPRTFRNTSADEGTHIRVVISGAAGNAWSLVREGTRWALYRSADAPVTSQVTLDAETAWRLFTKGMDAATAAQSTQIEGDRELGGVVLHTVSILA